MYVYGLKHKFSSVSQMCNEMKLCFDQMDVWFMSLIHERP